MKIRTLLFPLLLITAVSISGISSTAGFPTSKPVTPERHVSAQMPPTDQPQSEDIPEDWLTSAQDYIRRSEYFITWQDSTYLLDLPDAYQAPNRAQNLRTYFTPRGIHIIRRTNTAPSWYFGMELSGYGYSSQIQPVEDAELVVSDNFIQYQRGDLIEWYLNNQRGLEQGFTLMSPPGTREVNGNLHIEIVIDGSLTPSLDEISQAVLFKNTQGKHILRYGGLQVLDAGGRSVPASLSLTGSTLTIVMDDRYAIYPLRIDPIISTTADWSKQKSGGFGRDIGTAGDVNGDGYDDLLVGAYSFDNGQEKEGKVFLYYGSKDGLSSSADWTAESNKVEAEFGRSASTAGDINGDGYNDIMIGAYGYTNGQENEGGVWVWYGSKDGLGPNGTRTNADWSAESNFEGARLGTNARSAGDVNNDGYDDIIVGAYNWYDGIKERGRVFVWYGSKDGLGPDGTPGNADWIGGGYDNHYGNSVSSAGDVNDDGFDDIIVGIGHSNYQRGKVYVYHGSDTGLDDFSKDSHNWSVAGVQTDGYFGGSVSTAGDVNGDGFDDVIIGAHRINTADTESGKLFAWYGSGSGLGPITDTLTTADWIFAPGQADALLGESVSAAGDVDGDGYSDVIASAPWYDNGEDKEGRVYLFYGSADGLGDSEDWSFEPDQAGFWLGYDVAAAGDVNGDGADDFALGSFRNAWAHVFYGVKSRGIQLPSSRLELSQSGSQFGFAVSAVPSVNGGTTAADVYEDVIIGAPYYDGGQTDEGRVFGYYGTSSGLPSTPDWGYENDTPNSHLGFAVSSAGDLSNDSWGDIMVSAPEFKIGMINYGAIYYFYGKQAGLPNVEDLSMSGMNSNSKLGYSLSYGNINGDSYDDVFISEPGWLNGSSNKVGRVIVLCGDGFPTSICWQADGNQIDSGFGKAIANAGDVNNDGYDDLLTGAPDWDDSQSDEGAAFLWLGSSSCTTSTKCTETFSSADWMVEGDQNNAYLGTAVSSVGKINSDNYDDFLVGAPGFDKPGPDAVTDAGLVNLYHGSATPLDTTPDWSVYGDQWSNASFGASLGRVGDFNKDNFNDIIVGAPDYNYKHPLGGRAFLYFGTSSGPSSTYMMEMTGDTINAHSGTLGEPADFNNDGYDDFLVGAYGIEKALLYLGRDWYQGLSATNDGPTDLGKATNLSAELAFGENANITYEWTFGDGATQSGQQEPHTYGAAGVYTAKVSVSDPQKTLKANTKVTVREKFSVSTGSGAYTTDDGQVTLDWPSGLPAGLNMYYTPLDKPSWSTGGLKTAGVAFTLVCKDKNGDPVTSFSPPLELSVNYKDSDIPAGTNESDIKVKYYDTTVNNWRALQKLSQDTSANTITVRLDHMTEFLLVSEADLMPNKIFMPLTIKK